MDNRNLDLNIPLDSNQPGQETTPIIENEVQPNLVGNSPKVTKIITYVLVLVIIFISGAFGIRVYQEKTAKEPEAKPSLTPSPSVLPLISPTKIPASPIPVEWKNYQNEKYGYSINYPNIWFDLPNYGAPDNDKYFSNKNITSPMEGGLEDTWATVRVNKNSDYFGKIFLGEIGMVLKSGINTTKLANLTIGDYAAAKYSEETSSDLATEYGYSIVYAIKKDEEVYTLSFSTVSKAVAEKNSWLYDQMANSFKFLPNSWKVYESKVYGFTVRYPYEWIVKEFEERKFDSEGAKGNVIHAIGFGTEKSVPGGMIWQVSVHDITGEPNSQIEQLIGEIGIQFVPDRVEKREQVMLLGNPVTKVIITTSQEADWYTESVIFTGKKEIFIIGNGAVKNNKFEDFYLSFKYL